MGNANFRLGSVWYSLAEGWFHQGYTGLRPLHSKRQSIFPGRSNTPGLPGIQNVQDSDLRWGISSFAGGEGQKVIDPSDDSSFRRFDRSLAIDLSDPGQLQLAKAMQLKGSSGSGAITTLEASSGFADDVGASSVIGTDRRFTDPNDRIKTGAVALDTGAWQLEFFGYEDPPVRYNGNTLDHVADPLSEDAPLILLKGDGATVGKHAFPLTGPVTVRASLAGVGVATPSGPTGGPGSISIAVYDHASRNLITSERLSVGASVTRIFEVTFTARAGHSYDYEVKAISLNGLKRAEVAYIEQDVSDDRIITYEVRKAGVTVASGTKKVNGATTSISLGKVAIVEAAGPEDFVLRMSWSSGSSRKVYADRATYRQITMNDPRVVELGLDDRIWLGDHAAGLSPNLFYWDPQNDKWVASGTFGASGDVLGALAHSDHYEYVTNVTDRKVYKATRGAAGVAATNALGDTPVGLCVGGSRLLILTEATANGTRLYEHDLEAAAGAPTLDYTPGNKGVTIDSESPQRMAATKNGAVFFANQGPDCWAYLWDGTAGLPLSKAPTGFRGQAIAHGSGDTWLVGSFPAVALTGATQYRPAVLFVPSDGSAPQLLDIKLWRDDDPAGSRVVGVQLYGTDLWVGIEVPGDVPKMRLWRISLRSPIAAFCHQEVTTNETQTAGHLRGIAITWRERLIAWSIGPPYMETASFGSTGQLLTSRYGFGLTEEKELLSIDLEADIPAGCSVVVSYSADGATPVDTVYTAQGRQSISVPQAPVFATTLAITITLNSSDPALSPVVYRVVPRAFLAKAANQLLAVALECLNFGTAGAFVWTHPDGTPKPGAYGVANLDALARLGAVVEFEDAFTDPNNPRVGIASIIDIDLEGIRKGEGIAHVTLLEQ